VVEVPGSGEVSLSLSATPNPAELGDVVQLRAQLTDDIDSIVSITWQSNQLANFSCLDCYDPTFVATNSTSVVLDLNLPNGCILTDSLLVNVINNLNVYIPNAFSPNYSISWMDKRH
jgi:hypothetical protein